MPSNDLVPLPHHGPSDIALWRVDIDFTVALDAPAFSSLDENERTRAGNFRRHEDALRFAVVRAALREQLARRLDIAAHAVRFALDANHRPHLADSNRLDFNVSHAGAYGLIALSAVRRVGVDIEQHSDRFDWHSIAGLTLDPQETAWIERLDTERQPAAFYDAWVAKEALVKTTGVGITRGLQHLAVLPRESQRVTLRNPIPDELREVGAHWLGAPQAPEGYAACVAWSMAAIGP